MKPVFIQLTFTLGIFCLVFISMGVFSVSAQAVDQANGRYITCGQNDLPDCNVGHLIELVNKVINFLVFQVAIMLATAIIVWAGALYVLYPYKPGNKELAKKMMISAVGGLVIILSSYVIIRFVVTSLVGPNTTNDNAGVVEELLNIFEDVPDTSGN